MFNRRHLLLAGTGLAASGAIALGGCFKSKSSGILDTAYINGEIWTGSSDTHLVASIGFAGNRITAIGKDAVSAATGPMTQIIDLKGAFMAPGMIDNHSHFLLASQSLTQINLRQASTPEIFTNMIGEKARSLGPGKWILGGNWDEQLWGGELPSHQWIDSGTPENPVAIARLDLHSLFLNALALKLAGIDRNTPDPQGGVIVRDAHGEPTGVLKDNARDFVLRVIPDPTIQEKQASFREGIAHGLSFGVTQMHVKAITWDDHDTLRALRTHGETDMRFSSFIPIKDWERLHTLIQEEGRGDEWVRWGGVKGVFDGSLGAGTAWFRDPYTDEPDNSGMAFDNTKDLHQWILDADRHNLHVAIHAIGDYANEQVLDIFEQTIAKNGPRDRRFLIEHAQHLNPKSFPRFKELDVIASMQPYHAIDDGRWAVNRIGEARLNGTYAFGSLLKAGATVSFGTDWPVAPLDPRLGLEAAVLRQTIDGANPEGWLPEEKITIEQALKAYTVTNAYAGFQEDTFGKLLPGYTADFVIYEENLLTVDPEKIGDVKIIQTVVNGESRFGNAV
ncbi:MAG: amidohydrolase [Alphaproteobacteria bacterium]|nr:MAG: amidohydrolase [Alphaproteobacteria bacterium]